MASTPQTQGFQVGVIPNVQFANPQFFNPYGALSQGLQSGVGMASQLADIAYRQQQQNQQLTLAPLQQALLQAQISNAQKQAGVPDIIWGDTTVDDQTKTYPAALDENGQPTGQPSTEYGDLVRTTKGTKYLPGGGTEAVQKSEVVKTARERQAEADNRESIIAQREAMARAAEERNAIAAERDRLKAENDRIKADAMKTRAEYLANNPALEHRTIERNGKKFIQYFPKGKPADVIEEVDAGAYNNSIFAPGAIFQGPQAGVTPGAVSAAIPAAPSDDLAAVLAEQYGAVGAKPAVAAPVAAARPAIAPVQPFQFTVPNAANTLPTVKTKSEWEALPKGSSYLGVDGKVYIKGS